MKITKKVQIQINEFCKKNEINLLVLFGSFIKNKHKIDSDLDVALLSKKKLNKLKLIVQLELIFQKEIDIVSLTFATDPLLRYEIFFSGKPVFENSIGLFEEEKLKSWKLYIDTKKIRDLRDQSIKKYIRKIKSDIGSA
jgi:predicted nucleotidyltransferase